MDFYIKMIFEILSYSSVLVITVLGLAVIISMMGVFNIAHGEFVLLGAYTVYIFEVLHLPVWLGMLAAPIVLGIFGMIIERLVIRRLYANAVVGILATYALGIVIRESIRALLEGKSYHVALVFDGSFEVFGIMFSIWRLVIIILTLLIIVACYALLTRTSVGLKVRGALDNPALARSSGISTTRLYSFAFAFGSALAGLAGALIVPLYGISADLGLLFLVQSFLSALVGGIGGFIEPILGGAIFGLSLSGFKWVRNFSGLDQFMAPVFVDVLVFVVALIVVKYRPNGIFSSS